MCVPLDWRDLSLREKIGQTMMFKADPGRELDKQGNLEEFLTRYPVGGVFLCGEVLTGPGRDREDILRISEKYREASRFPLPIAADVENGCGSLAEGMASLPHLMALGATSSPELAYAYGKTIALESVSIGLDWSLAPVADLNLNPFNPIVNIRAVADAPGLAIRLLTELVRGMQANGLAATAKHFPGDGVDYRDQHLVTTCNSLPREEWRRNHGAVFQALIDGGVDAVMTGHISLPAYQGGATAGDCLPATLSYELTTRLLKEEMGFGGVVISDALDMGGFLKWYGRSRGEVECFKAGTDVLLWPTLGYFDLLERAIAAGEIPMTRLDDAVARIWRLKERRGLLDRASGGRRELAPDDLLYIEDTAARVAAGGPTLLRDQKTASPGTGRGQERSGRRHHPSRPGIRGDAYPRTGVDGSRHNSRSAAEYPPG